MTFVILNIIIASVLFYRVLRKDVASDFTKWQNNIPVKHTKEWAIRALNLIPTLLFLTLPIYHFSLDVLYKFISVCSLVAFVYLVLFNGWYNRKRNFDFWFTGSNDADDPITDNILQLLSKPVRIILQLAAIAVSLFFYIKFQF